jgi:hypothetical protein
MGKIEVPAEHYWGAQTQRSLIHFSIGDDHMPQTVYHSYGYVKKAAALVNEAGGRLDPSLADAIGVTWRMSFGLGGWIISYEPEPAMRAWSKPRVRSGGTCHIQVMP